MNNINWPEVQKWFTIIGSFCSIVGLFVIIKGYFKVKAIDKKLRESKEIQIIMGEIDGVIKKANSRVPLKSDFKDELQNVLATIENNWVKWYHLKSKNWIKILKSIDDIQDCDKGKITSHLSLIKNFYR